jgi:hypothetical protein
MFGFGLILNLLALVFADLFTWGPIYARKA